MARKVITTVTDDLDGSDGADTVTFSIDGVAYEIDLSESNARKLHAALQPYVDAGRRIGRNAASTARRSAPGPSRDLNAIREWAAKNGHKVSDRGRVAQAVIDAYEQAN